MAGSLHGSARTTPRVRAELQASQEATSILAQRYGLSRTTVAKWRTRTTSPGSLRQLSDGSAAGTLAGSAQTPGQGVQTRQVHRYSHRLRPHRYQ